MKKLVLGTAFAAALIAGTSAQGADKDVLDMTTAVVKSLDEVIPLINKL